MRHAMYSPPVMDEGLRKGHPNRFRTFGGTAQDHDIVKVVRRSDDENHPS
jgi:hypothetical protein